MLCIYEYNVSIERCETNSAREILRRSVIIFLQPPKINSDSNLTQL